MIPESELIQLLCERVIPHRFGGKDVNRWSRIHPRFMNHQGCVVDLGCLRWDWSGFFLVKKEL